MDDKEVPLKDNVNETNQITDNLKFVDNQYENSFSANEKTYSDITTFDQKEVIGFDRSKNLSLKRIILKFDIDNLTIIKGKESFSYTYDQVQITRSKPIKRFNFYQKAILEYAIIRSSDGNVFRVGFVNLVLRQLWLFFALGIIGIGVFMISPILAMVIVSIVSISRNPLTTMFINEDKNDASKRVLYGNANYKQIYKGEIIDSKIIENFNKSIKFSRLFGSIFLAALLSFFFLPLSLGFSAVILNGGFVDSELNVDSTLNLTKNYVLSIFFTIIFGMIVAYFFDKFNKKHLELDIDPIEIQKSESFFNKSVVIKSINEKSIRITIFIAIVLVSVLCAIFWNIVFKNDVDNSVDKSALNDITQDEININNVTSNDISSNFEANATLAYQFTDSIELKDNVTLNNIKCDSVTALNYADYVKFIYVNEGKMTENEISDYQSYSFSELKTDKNGYSYATKIFRKPNPGLGLDYINIITRHKSGEKSCIVAFVASDDKYGLEQQSGFGNYSDFKLGKEY